MLLSKSKDNLYSAPENRPERGLVWLEGEFIPQSLQFMVDLLPTIRKLIKGWPREKILEVLDVGTGSGAGANFLGTLHRSNFFGAQMKVDALDTSPAYKRYAESNFKCINSYISGDIFGIDKKRTWDLVICSHTIEHIKKPDVFDFIKELQSRSRLWTLFYTPWEEHSLIPGDHLTSFNKEIIDSLKPESVQIIEETQGWKHPIDEESRCVIFTLKGISNRASTTTKEEDIKIMYIRQLIEEKEDYENAIIELAPLLNKLPANSMLNYLMAYCIHRLNKNLQNALDYYSLALEYGFDEFWVRYSRGSLYYLLGNYKAARIDLERASFINPLHEGPQLMLKQLEQSGGTPAF